jgi:hypothetical protein
MQWEVNHQCVGLIDKADSTISDNPNGKTNFYTINNFLNAQIQREICHKWCESGFRAPIILEEGLLKKDYDADPAVGDILCCEHLQLSNGFACSIQPGNTVTASRWNNVKSFTDEIPENVGREPREVYLSHLATLLPGDVTSFHAIVVERTWVSILHGARVSSSDATTTNLQITYNFDVHKGNAIYLPSDAFTPAGSVRFYITEPAILRLNLGNLVYQYGDFESHTFCGNTVLNTVTGTDMQIECKDWTNLPDITASGKNALGLGAKWFEHDWWFVIRSEGTQAEQVKTYFDQFNIDLTVASGNSIEETLLPGTYTYGVLQHQISTGGSFAGDLIAHLWGFENYGSISLI